MKVLFMCTANSCRSVLCEGLFNLMAPQGLSAASAGSMPSGRLNPRAVNTLQALGADTSALFSKGSDSFAEHPPEVVITVCDINNEGPCILRRVITVEGRSRGLDNRPACLSRQFHL